ncbi:3-hydroxy-3-methylglutaryl-coenzyme A reductase [Aphelenchoides besseyi]|nr:3-hydroxy-3-methylglutaryl-coenzyme A reductase [Aphelenchoides besseyi]KAI6210537.1 3-hydroxy-3-methylglutaryl-coenzyme A reductase [Aphelenchoides besseyi]
MSLIDLKNVFDKIICDFIDPSGRSELCDRLVEAVRTWNSSAKFTIGEVSDYEQPSKSKDVECQTANEISSVSLPLQRLKLKPDEQQLLTQLRNGTAIHRNLEKICGPAKAVEIRRQHLEETENLSFEKLPYRDFDYVNAAGQCIENSIGYTTLPVGYVGPLNLNNERVHSLFATTEGALVASVNRGCKAVSKNGVKTSIIDVGMTRAPVFEFVNVLDAQECIEWIEANYVAIKSVFEGTSRFCKLKSIVPVLDKFLYLRFRAFTGDAMGMNMITKAVQAAVEFIEKQFQGRIKLLSLSGNLCCDKKAAAINWDTGRGKVVKAEAVVPASVVKSVLKTDVHAMAKLADAKLMIGSKLAGTIGGSNAQAANVVAAMFIACGQDAAQVVSSSMCSTKIEATEEGDLYISCTMNCLEVGTVGGGTILEAQKTALKILQCDGPNIETPGANANRFAQIVCATVLAGELSLLAAQCTDDLVRSHMVYNRSSRSLETVASCPTTLNESSRLKSRHPNALPRELGGIPCAGVFH